MATVTATDPLTPSEVIYLVGERFTAKPGMLDKYTLLSEQVVSKKELVTRMYAAAFLAADAVGNLCLELRAKKALLGLRTVQALCAVPARSGVAWPPSVESALIGVAARARPDKPAEVADVIYGYLGSDSTDPAAMAIERVRDALAGRNLVTTTEQVRLKVFKSLAYSLPPDTLTMAQAQAAAVQGLLDKAQKTQPEVWKTLVQAVASALARRRETPDIDSTSSD